MADIWLPEGWPTDPYLTYRMRREHHACREAMKEVLNERARRGRS